MFLILCLPTNQPLPSNKSKFMVFFTTHPTHRINYKILLLNFKALHGLAPEYLAELLQRYNPSRALRSGSQDLLVEPSFKLKTFGRRSFVTVAPRL